MYACICAAVTETAVRRAITERDLRSLDDIAEVTGAGTGCGRCHDHLAFLLEESSLRVAALDQSEQAPALHAVA